MSKEKKYPTCKHCGRVAKVCKVGYGMIPDSPLRGHGWECFDVMACLKRQLAQRDDIIKGLRSLLKKVVGSDAGKDNCATS